MVIKVLTINAPRGAITNERQLRRHLKRGKPLFEGCCGSISQVTYGADWSISVPRVFGRYESYRPLFLYPNRVELERDGRASSLFDRHIGTTGYNDNWWFESLETAEAYKADRSNIRN